MHNKEYYMFFKAGMPIAVFLTETEGEAIGLFCRLYKCFWNKKVSVKKEKDVPGEEWERIHKEYLRRDKKEMPITFVAPKPINDFFAEENYQTIILVTEKYLRCRG